MPTKFLPFTAEHESAVRAFNMRLAAGGSEWQYPETSLRAAMETHPSLYIEDFVAVDDDGAVHGAYVLKHQDFLIIDEVISIANYSLPVSEGIVDRRFGMLGVSMILDAQKRKRFLFDLGLGSMEAPSARVMKGVGWSLIPVPLFFRVLHMTKFLRNLTHQRTTPARRILLDTLAFSGAGWLGVKALAMAKRRRTPKMRGLVVEVVPNFDSWADEIWEDGKAGYRFVAVRDSGVLNVLYPTSSDRYQRLKVSRDGRVIGWAVVLDTQMTNHKQFGAMRLGSIADCFASIGDASAVVCAADRFLTDAGVDLIISNQSHDAWCGGLARLGYLKGPSNFIFTASKTLAQLLEPLETTLGLSHINRGDGDGPINL